MANPISDSSNGKNNVYVQRTNGSKINVTELVEQAQKLNTTVNIKCRSNEKSNTKPSQQLGRVSIYKETPELANILNVAYGCYDPKTNAITIFACDIAALDNSSQKQANKQITQLYALAHESGHLKDKQKGTVKNHKKLLEKREKEVATAEQKLINTFKQEFGITLKSASDRLHFKEKTSNPKIKKLFTEYDKKFKELEAIKTQIHNDFQNNKYSSSKAFKAAYDKDLKHQQQKSLSEVQGMDYFVNKRKNNTTPSAIIRETESTFAGVDAAPNPSDKTAEDIARGEVYAEHHATIQIGKNRFNDQNMFKKYFPNTHKLVQQQSKNKK